MHLEAVDVPSYLRQIRHFGFDTQTVGSVTYQAQKFEILQVDATAPNSDNKRLLIFAGVHGNEFAAALAVLDILKDVQDNPNDYADWQVRIIAPLNPVGLAYQSRYNEEGKDINRDFKLFETTGAKVQKQAIEVFRPDLIVSMHEGPQDGFFVIGDGRLPRSIAERVAHGLHNAEVKIATKSFLGVSIKRGFWLKGSPVYALQKTLGIYTLGRLVRENNLGLLTTESPWVSKDVTARRRAHLAVIRAIVTS